MTRRIILLLAIAGMFTPVPRCLVAADTKLSQAAALRSKVHNVLRDTARMSDKRHRMIDKRQAAQHLLEVYQALDADTSVIRDDRRQMQQVVRGRLAKLADEIRKLPALQPADDQGNLANQGLQEFIDALVDRSIRPGRQTPPAVLAQRQRIPNPAAIGNFPGQVPSASGPPADYGQDLVELIEATIAPASWDTNGGPGTIRYFGPLRVIVVRQTSEVHEQLGDLLPQLRN